MDCHCENACGFLDFQINSKYRNSNIENKVNFKNAATANALNTPSKNIPSVKCIKQMYESIMACCAIVNSETRAAVYIYVHKGLKFCVY